MLGNVVIAGIVIVVLEMGLNKQYKISLSDEWDAPNLHKITNDLKNLRIGATAVINVADADDTDLSSVVSVSRVLDGWSVFSPAEFEPNWVSLLRELLSISQRTPVTDF